MGGVVRKVLAAAGVCVASVAVTVGGGSAGAAAVKPISAKIPAGYVLVAIAKDGTAAVGKKSGATTKLTPTASTVTLHLLSTTGSYAGPIVVGTKKSGSSVRAILGVRAGASVGKVTYSKSLGYGRASVAAKSIVSSVFARASKSGVPVGAGSLGYTISVGTKGVSSSSVSAFATAEESQAGGDPDKDGIPNAVDVDDNGDGKLDVVDEKTVNANKSMTGPRPTMFSDFFVDLERIIRVSDAASAEATKEIVKEKLKFVFGMSPDGGKVTNVRIDCLGIKWCATATVFPNMPSDPKILWSTVDKDGDGRFFDLGKRDQGNTWNYDSSISPNVYPKDVQPGQMFNFEASYGGGKTVIIPSALTSFFVTAPAPKVIGKTPISYPVQGAKGSWDNPIPTGDGTKLYLQTYRPLRPLLPSESSAAGMKEMGGLGYWLTVSKVGEEQPPTTCPGEAYSELSPGTQLRDFFAQKAVMDDSPDSSPDTPTPVSFVVDLAKCRSTIGLGDKVYIDMNVGDAAFNHTVANFHVLVKQD